MNTPHNQIDAKTFAIGVLSITAVILMVGLMLVGTAPRTATASEVSTIAGDFTLGVGQVTRDTELLYVIDNVTQRLLVYGFNRRTGESAIVDKTELSAALMQRQQP